MTNNAIETLRKPKGQKRKQAWETRGVYLMKDPDYVAARLKVSRLQAALEGFGQGGVVRRENGIQRIVREAVVQEKPIGLIMFWGAGEKSKPSASDSNLIDTLHDLQTVVLAQHEPGIHIQAIAADVHVVENGYRNDAGELTEEAKNYYQAVVTTATNRGLNISWHALSDLYKKTSTPMLNGNLPEVDPMTEEILKRHEAALINNARKHSRIQNPEQSGRRYGIMRIQEKTILASTFPNHILIATGISNGARDIILPDTMPGIFLGGKAPWFQND